MPILLGLLSAAVAASPLDAQESDPYTLNQLVQIVESDVFSDERVLFLVQQNCLGFVLDEVAAIRLRAAGASETLIASLRAQCVVLPPPVDTVLVAPPRLELFVGDSRNIRARALTADSVDVPDIVVKWSSSDTTIATVTAGGVVTAISPGEARIVARTDAGPSGAVPVRVLDRAAAAVDTTAAGARRGKSVATAAALGVVLPGGGEFYTGNRTKGIIVAVGSIAALAAGYLITTDDVLDTDFSDPGQPICSGSTCSVPVQGIDTVEETRQLVIGAAVAGAFWVYGLVDGILRAQRSNRTTSVTQPARGGASVQLAPPDGIRLATDGDVEITLVRIRP